MIKIYNLLESFTDSNKTTNNKVRIYKVFIPIFLLLEYITYWWFWKKIVIGDLLTSDVIVDFLDKNEFEYTGNKLIKMDLIESNPYFDRLSLVEAQQTIKKEYVEAFSELITTNIPTNIEDYITLYVETEIKIVKSNNENYRNKIYIVNIQFCRYAYLQNAIKIFKYWLLSIIFGIPLLILGIKMLPVIYHFIINL